MNFGPEALGLAPLAVSLQASVLHCCHVTRTANSSFPIAFQFLSTPKRQAMNALYAFLRISDDLADEAGELAAKRERLQLWRAGLLSAMEGKFTHPIHPALAVAVRRYAISSEWLLAALDGVESDLEPRRFATFADLYPYCYRVASVVGLACVRIWGCRPGIPDEWIREAMDSAEAAGIAFQLTNILRDLKEDLTRGRVYLPSEELARFGVSPQAGLVGNSGFRDFMHFQVARARHFYRQAERLDCLLSSEGRAIFRVMAGTYSCLLAEIERDVPRVLTDRVSLPHWRKGLLLLKGWSVKRGWG